MCFLFLENPISLTSQIWTGPALFFNIRSMSILRKSRRSSIFPRCYFHGGLKFCCYATELCCLHCQPRVRQERNLGKQLPLYGSGSLPLFRMFKSTPHRPYPASLHLQQMLLNHLFSPFSKFDSQSDIFSWNSNWRGFCSVTFADSDSDSDLECNDGGHRNSNADPKEVDKLCRVIVELFEQVDNLKVVLDEIEVHMSNDLVLDVLHQLRNSSKLTFWFFYWAAERPRFRHDSRTYNRLMTILGSTRQFETMVLVLEEMGEKGLLTIDTFAIAIQSFAAAKERKKCVGLFELMNKYKFEAGVGTINCLLDNLGCAKLGKEAQNLFEKLKDRFEPNMKTYTVLLSGWWRGNNLMEAGRVWNEMIDKGMNPDIVAHNIMMAGLLRSKKRSDAIKLFEFMKAKGPSPTIQSYSILIKELCKHSKMEEAVQYFDEMVASGCQPDVGVYTSLIIGCGRQKKMDMVFGLLKKMKERQFPPDGHTYNALIQLMTVEQRPDDAARVYREMIQDRIQPSLHTYNMMMKSCFQVQNCKLCGALWNEMGRRGWRGDDRSYTIFSGSLINQGRSVEACKYIEEMIEKGMKVPQLDYNKFAADFAKAGKPDILEELAVKMKLSRRFEASSVFARWSGW